MANCSQCQAHLTDGDRFCGECGAAAPSPEVADPAPFCHHCGEAVAPDDSFCGACGAPRVVAAADGDDAEPTVRSVAALDHVEGDGPQANAGEVNAPDGDVLGALPNSPLAAATAVPPPPPNPYDDDSSNEVVSEATTAASAPSAAFETATELFDEAAAEGSSERRIILVLSGAVVVLLVLVGVLLATRGDGSTSEADDVGAALDRPIETSLPDSVSSTIPEPATTAAPTTAPVETAVTTVPPTTVAPTTLPPPPPVAAVTASRLLDTRADQPTVDGDGAGIGRRVADEVTTVQVAGRGGIPSEATAAEFSLVAVRPDGGGFITAYPCDVERPNASSLNYGVDRTSSGAAIVALSAAGTICVYTSQSIDLIVDTTAFVGANSAFAPLTPARLVDSRPGQATADGESAGIGRRAPEQVTTVPVAGRGGIPADAKAAIFNVVAVRPDAAGFITVYPCDEGRPNTSTVNYGEEQTTSGGATVRISAEGTICIYTRQAADLIVDTTAFIPATSSFAPLTPSRLVDTRGDQPTTDGLDAGIGRRTAGQVTAVQVTGRGGVSPEASAVVIGVVAVRPEAPGFITAYPCDEDRPNTSTLNHGADQTTSGSATVRVGAEGTICVYTQQETDLIVDVTAFIPGA